MGSGSLEQMAPLGRCINQMVRPAAEYTAVLGAGLDAAEAGFRVGYDSPSQFSREYRRLFGAPPVRDMGRLRAMPQVAMAI